MLTKKKHIILAISIITIALATVAAYFILHNSPTNFIEGKLKFNLPNESKIVNYHRKEDRFEAKILIKKGSINDLKEKLKNTIGSFPIEHVEETPTFINRVPWWDLDKHDIEDIYNDFVDEKKGSTTAPHEIWAIISKIKDGQFYLYLSY